MSEQIAENRVEIGQKLRVARKSQKLSLQELANKASVSPSLLSKIETGKANPSFRSLSSIATALSLPIQDFFLSAQEKREVASSAQSSSRSNITTMTASELRLVQAEPQNSQTDFPFSDSESTSSPIVRADERPRVNLQGGVTWERLTPQPDEKAEFLYINYEVGAKSGEKMSHHEGRQFILVLKGKLLLELGFESCPLSDGDSITFDGVMPHRVSNVGEIPAQVVSVLFNK